ncbi:fibrillarin [Candidatus Pacearchaeota archaeon CG06_land_8_20_14_3_00_35_12]|nr:MAG: fibrillarin [Candidatus Pacearchaeota archaeon CG06_land_8_20_14_3_00_35_12]
MNSERIKIMNRMVFTKDKTPRKPSKLYREWNPLKSKWCAAIRKGIEEIIPPKDAVVLYLGASTGTTVSHISDLTDEIIFAVENSAEMAIPLIRLAEKRRNIAPIFSDARDIEYIKKAMFGKKINILFQDIPSRDQVEILIKNSDEFADKNTQILFSLKTQSISQQNPDRTYREVTEKLKKHFLILKNISLDPFHRKHYFFVLSKI